MNELASELLSVQAISEQDILLLKCPKILCDPITVMNLRHNKIKYKHRNEKEVNGLNQQKRQARNGGKDSGPTKHELRVINKAIEEFKREIEFIKKRFEMEMKPIELISENNEPFHASKKVKLKNSKNHVTQNSSFRKWKNSIDATRVQENMSMKGELGHLKRNCRLDTEKMDNETNFSFSEKSITVGPLYKTTDAVHNDYSEYKYIKCEADSHEIQLNNSNAPTGLLCSPEHVTNQIVYPHSNKLRTASEASLESENGMLSKKHDAHLQSNIFTQHTKKSEVKEEISNVSEVDIPKFNQTSNKQIMSKYYYMWKKYIFQRKFHENSRYQSSSSKETCEHKIKIERLIELLEKKKVEQKLLINKAENENFNSPHGTTNKNRKISATSTSITNEIKADLNTADGSCSATLKKTNKILIKYKLACEERDRLMDSLAKARKIRKLEADNEINTRQPVGEVPKWVFNPVHIIETTAKERSKMRKMQIKQRELRREAEIQALLKEEELRQEEERSHLQSMSQKANEFYKNLLFKKYLIRPLNILASMRKLNYDKCEIFRKKKLLHFYFDTWIHITLTPFKVAQNFTKKSILKRGYSAFLNVRIEAIENNQVAIDFYDYFFIPHQAFTCWMKYHHIQIYKMERKMKISIFHYNRVLIQKYFSCWKIFHQDKELEARRNIWRMRVQEILPDFTPTLFCSRM